MLPVDLLALVWILILTVILLATYMYLKWPYNYFKNRGIPGPKPTLLIGNLTEVGKKPFWDKDIEWIEKYGKVVGTFLFSTRNLVVADTEMLKEILIKDFDNFCNRSKLYGRGVLKYGVFDMMDEPWKHQRQLLSPYFSVGTMKMNVPVINDILDSTVKWLEVKCNQGLMVDAKDFSQRITMDAICRTAFGVQVNSFENPNSEILKKCKEFFLGFGNTMLMLTFMFPLFGQLIETCNACIYKIGFLEKLCQHLVEERKKASQSSGYDFIHQLLKERLSSSKDLSDDEIIGNAILFLLAGYDTTAGTIYFLLYNLTVHPEWQDKIIQEIEDTIGDQKLTYENIQQLQCVEMCLNESQRLFPIAPRVERVCVKDNTVKGVLIQKNTVVVIPIWYLHRQPDVWENPEKFHPERFTPENKKSRDPIHYMPFGFGPRHCIGMRLALLEIKMSAVRILQKFRLKRNEKTEVPLELDPKGFTASARNSVWISLECRN